MIAVPISPLNMLQEQQMGLPHQNWRILVVCMLLNQTHGRQVRPMIEELFGMCPSPQDLLEKVSEEHQQLRLLAMLRPLGFKNRRLTNLVNMSWDYLNSLRIIEHTNDSNWVKSIRGCGPYAQDSIAIFVYGADKMAASDTWLNDYLTWRRKWLAEN